MIRFYDIRPHNHPDMQSKEDLETSAKKAHRSLMGSLSPVQGQRTDVIAVVAEHLAEVWFPTFQYSDQSNQELPVRCQTACGVLLVPPWC